MGNFMLLTIRQRTFLIAIGAVMVDMIILNFSKSEMACRCGCDIYEIDNEFRILYGEHRKC